MNINRFNKGIVLITTLLIIGFLLMFAAGIIFTTQRQATMTNQFLHRESAIYASQTGINYALMRLQADPYWMGCTRNSSGLTGSDYTFTMDGGKKIDIREYQISGNMGAVEGRVDGGNGGYFEIYFVKPEDAKAKMSFFGSSKGKLTQPVKIPLSSNRNNQFTAPSANPGDEPSTWTKYSDDTYYKPVPENAILLVCRGTMGNEHKTLEVCLRMGPGEDYNSVAIGRGNIEISINPSGKLYLDTVVADKPPIIRTKGNITIGNGLTTTTDYLTVNGSGGGRASGNVGFTPAPQNNANTFQSGVPVQDNMYPPLQWSNVVPNTSSFGKLNAGYYKIENNMEQAKVTYYPINTPDELGDEKVTPVTDGSDTLTMLINNGTFKWDSKNQVLELNKSVDVAQYKSISNLMIVGGSDNPVDIELKSVIDPKKGETNNVYLVNNNDGGNIQVEGSLSGIGTVVLKGSLDMQGESQLSAVEDSGISIYAQGSININALKTTPKRLKGTETLTNDDRSDLNDAINMICQWTSEQQSASIASNKPKQDKYILTKANCQLKYGIDETTWNLYKSVGLVSKGDIGSYKNVEYLFITERDINNAIAANVKYTGKAGKKNKLGKDIDPKDCKFTGLIFTCKNFYVNIPDNDFALTGGLVAYGGDPSSGSTVAGTGSIKINAFSADFTYDTKYLSLLSGLTQSKIETLYWGSY